MGGRGTFAAGNPVPYSYQTVDTIEGIKVLEGIAGKHGLPESAHSSNACEMRFYDKNRVLYLEIGYHPEKNWDRQTNQFYTITYITRCSAKQSQAARNYEERLLNCGEE